MDLLHFWFSGHLSSSALVKPLTSNEKAQHDIQVKPSYVSIFDPHDDTISVMLLERGIRDISRVLVLARNSVYSARSVEDAIPHVYKMEGHRSLRENPLILSS